MNDDNKERSDYFMKTTAAMKRAQTFSVRKGKYRETIGVKRIWRGTQLVVSPFSAWPSTCLAVVIRCVTHQPSSSPDTLVLCLPPFCLIRAPIFASRCTEVQNSKFALLTLGLSVKRRGMPRVACLPCVSSNFPLKAITQSWSAVAMVAIDLVVGYQYGR